MIVDILNQQKTITIDSKTIKKLVYFVLKEEKSTTDEVAIHFVTSRKMIGFHKKFFQDPTPTDCISLPIDQPHIKRPHHCLGEIFICPKRAVDYVQTTRKKLVMPEIYLYVIHSLLHLLGYNDMRKNERMVMKKREKEILKKFITLSS